jgi:iron only hydrogenase large subunit-like protein
VNDSTCEPVPSVATVTVMPCFDKKLEASRLDFTHEGDDSGGSGFKEVDLVLTSVEVLQLLERRASEHGLAPKEFLAKLAREHSASVGSQTESQLSEGTSEGTVEALLHSNM